MPPLNVLIKPASSKCNMRCRYCFYADEAKKRDTADYGLMRLDTAEILVRKALSYADGSCVFGFQGGEPTLWGLDNFRTFMDLVQKYDTGRAKITFTLQTNGLLLDEEWAHFLKEHNFLIGLSLDGDRLTHDLNRVDAKGNGTFSRVISAAHLLKKCDAAFNILTVVNSRVARRAETIYHFYQKNGLLYQQYIPCLNPLFEPQETQVWSLTTQAYGSFLIQLFDLWYRDRAQGKFVYIHYFESLLGMLQGYAPASCGMTGFCSAQNVIEADGSVYPCDFYALDEYRLGNVHTDEFADFEARRKPFLEASLAGLEKCRTCRHGYLCRGGCRRDRQTITEIGENRLCAAYMRFFDHAEPKLCLLITGQRTSSQTAGAR